VAHLLPVCDKARRARTRELFPEEGAGKFPYHNVVSVGMGDQVTTEHQLSPDGAPTIDTPA